MRIYEDAKVAELVDALALGASGATRESSNLSFRTRFDGVCESLSRRAGMHYSPALKYRRGAGHDGRQGQQKHTRST